MDQQAQCHWFSKWVGLRLDEGQGRKPFEKTYGKFLDFSDLFWVKTTKFVDFRKPETPHRHVMLSANGQLRPRRNSGPKDMDRKRQ